MYRASWLSRVMNLILVFVFFPVDVLILWWPSGFLSFPFLVSTTKLLGMLLSNHTLLISFSTRDRERIPVCFSLQLIIFYCEQDRRSWKALVWHWVVIRNKSVCITGLGRQSWMTGCLFSLGPKLRRCQKLSKKPKNFWCRMVYAVWSPLYTKCSLR